VIILDGPMGTELAVRGVPTPLPGWSAHALRTHPEVVSAVHEAYAEAGAMMHTANTFRTRRRTCPDDWEALARRAVKLAREVADRHGGRVAGSLAPLEDCYRPDLSPASEVARVEHGEHARVLADAGCDLLLCETFPHVPEALVALEASLATGLEVWVSFTPGHRADLLTPDEVAAGARSALRGGASCVLVNCVPARSALPYVEALAPASGKPFGVYANAGSTDDAIGWSPAPQGPRRQAELAATWRAVGASVVGGCCGTGPAHVRALAASLTPT